MENKLVTVGASSVINVKLESDAKVPGEVVIRVMELLQKKSLVFHK
jgi:hypothetical protein